MTEPTSSASFQDRSVRLRLFGAVMVLMGGACVLLAGLQALLLLGSSVLPADVPSLAADPRSVFSGVLLYVLIGACFVWAGLGSLRRRRWVRSIMLTLCWTWVLGGLMTLALTPAVLDSSLSMLSTTGADPVPNGVLRIVKLVVLASVVFFGIVVPAVMIGVYRDPDVQRTCETHDPLPSWTERAPTTVLGLSVGLAAAGVLVLPLLFRPVFPLFGAMLDGWPAAALLVAGGIAAVWLARSVYRLQWSGWWATTILLSLVGVSVAVTLWVVDPTELFAKLGYPEEYIAVAGSAAAKIGPLTAVVTVVLTVLSVIYMIVIRRHFAEGSGTRGR